MNRKKMLVTIGSMGRGGAERVISVLSNYYAEKKGWEVRILTLLDNRVEYELCDGVSVVEASGNTRSRLKNIPFWLKTIRNNVIEFKPDVVLSFVARINVLTLIACAGLHKKTVVSERNDPRFDGRGKIIDALTKLLYKKADAVVFQTKRAKEYFDKCGLKNSVIIANPIHIQCEASIPEKGKIVTVGRLVKQKNQKLLLSAFASILPEHGEARLHIYGSGGYKDELERFARELNLGDFVTFEGSVPDVHKRIADAALFVLSSDYEGLSNALLEAQMMGLPCVTTDSAGADEYIENGVNGLITPVGDEKALAEAINKLLDDGKLASAMGQEAKARSKCFLFDFVIQQWNEILE